MASPEHSTSKPADLDGLQGWLTALPALVLALPGHASLLRNVPTTTSAGTGILALSCLPALALLAARRRPIHLRGLVPWLGLLLIASYGARTAGDPFAARRALLGLTGGIGLVLAGASLGAGGRRTLLHGLCLASAMLLADTLLDQLGNGTHLPLGNSGDLSEAILPGAVLALVASGSSSRLWKSLALLMGAGTLLLMGCTPVMAGLVSLLGTGLLCFSVSRASSGPKREWARNLLLVGIGGWLVLAVSSMNMGTASVPESEPVATVATTPTATGGIKVRALIWASLPEVIRDAPWLGHGPGQFARVYPIYRDPSELELSSHGHSEPTPIEVEHAHNDWLQPFVEWGLIAGLAWMALLLVAARRGLLLLRESDAVSRALAAAALAVLINTLFNSTLLYGVASPAFGWPLLGVCLGCCSADSTSRLARRAGRLAPGLLLLILLANARSAFAFQRHGAHLARVVTAPVVVSNGVAQHSPEAIRPHLARALQAVPDSVVALEKYKQLQLATGATPDERRVTLARILSARPNSLGALIDRGILAAQEGEIAEALAVFSHAKGLDPENAMLRRNRLLLAVDVGGVEEVQVLRDELLSRKQAERDWFEPLAAQALMNGRVTVARVLMGVGADEWKQGEELLAQSQLTGRAGTLLGEGFVTASNALFARDHATSGDFESARRLYRQALRSSEKYPELPGRGRRLRLELAGALCKVGREAEAKDLMEGRGTFGVHDLRELPEWAGQALLDAGLLGN
ncbi:MAG: O-antigen ligase family protein [Planctomycetota bacterium]|nr:O-antigen ligase family protein [Planctomycetota bacterium]